MVILDGCISNELWRIPHPINNILSQPKIKVVIRKTPLKKVPISPYDVEKGSLPAFLISFDGSE